MASETVRAVLNHVLSALEPGEYPCALVGGIALAVWNDLKCNRRRIPIRSRRRLQEGLSAGDRLKSHWETL